jgi:hypothetical protein
VSRYFAELKSTLVQRVIVASSAAWCETALGGTWIETYMDDPSRNYAGIGYTYHVDKTNFAAPQPFASWLLDDACRWHAPIAQPAGMWQWNEAALAWRKPLTLTLDKATITADGADVATVSVWTAADVGSIDLDVRGEVVKLALTDGAGTLELTASAPTIAPHIVIRAVDQALFGAASVVLGVV